MKTQMIAILMIISGSAFAAPQAEMVAGKELMNCNGQVELNHNKTASLNLRLQAQLLPAKQDGKFQKGAVLTAKVSVEGQEMVTITVKQKASPRGDLYVGKDIEVLKSRINGGNELKEGQFFAILTMKKTLTAPARLICDPN